MSRKICTALVFIGALTGFTITASADDDSNGVKFPSEHRSWDHIRSSVILDKANPLFGFLSVYANKKSFKS